MTAEKKREAKVKELDAFREKFNYIITQHSKLVNELSQLTREANKELLKNDNR